MADNWKKIWDKRQFNYEVLKTNDYQKIFKELKKANGFDVVNDGLSIKALLKQFEDIKSYFAESFSELNFTKFKSVYEVGCGSGANLYLFEKEGLKVGGIDYSKALIEIARKILKSDDLVCDEALQLPQNGKYDIILSNSVFSYFPSLDYASQVLKKIYDKCKYSIGLIDIHNIDQKNEFIEYRRKIIENYDEKYKNLPKLFYSKEFFQDFALKHNMRIIFPNLNVESYWNNEFIFNCFMYK